MKGVKSCVKIEDGGTEYTNVYLFFDGRPFMYHILMYYRYQSINVRYTNAISNLAKTSVRPLVTNYIFQKNWQVLSQLNKKRMCKRSIVLRQARLPKLKYTPESNIGLGKPPQVVIKWKPLRSQLNQKRGVCTQ